MPSFYQKLSDDTPSFVDKYFLIILYAVAVPSLLYVLAVARYGLWVSNLLLLIVVFSFYPEANAIYRVYRPAQPTEVDDQSADHSSNTVIVAKHHWMMLAKPSIIAVTSVIILLFYKLVVSDNLKLTYTILIVVAFGLTVGFPYYATAVKLYRSYRQIPRLTLATRLAGVIGTVVIVATIVYALQDKGVSFDWFVSLVTFLGNLAVDLASLITASQFNVLLTIVVLTSINWLIQYVNWRINPFELDGVLFTEYSGIIRREPRTVNISKVTDINPVQFELTKSWLRLPWLRLRVETSGQDQALTYVHWVPRRMFEELMNRWNRERGA